MPLVRYEVKNEYGLGKPELYREANREDPKELLDGLAVAGLVGILRQLGDLAEFAAEVFHGIQEQVMATASRSHKLMVRVQTIEAALPPLEKAVLAQTSHIHFAYVAGSEWHPRIRTEKNHFIYNDLPRFVMDSYEECRDPPRLHLLDKFDSSGPGSCLKRYSDSTFFRRISDNCKETDAERNPKDKMSRKSKKKGSSQRIEASLNYPTMSNHSGRMLFGRPIENEHSSPSHTTSTIDMSLKSDLGEHSHSFDSRNGSSNMECVFNLGSLKAEQEPNEFSPSLTNRDDIHVSVFPNEEPQVADVLLYHSSPENTVRNSSCVTWDEMMESMQSNSQQGDEEETAEALAADCDLGTEVKQNDDSGNLHQITAVFANEGSIQSSFIAKQFEEAESEPDDFMDALNTIESESEIDLDFQTKREVEELSSNPNKEGVQDDELHVTVAVLDEVPVKSEAHARSDLSSDEEAYPDLPRPVLQDNFGHTQTSETAVSAPDDLPGSEKSTSAEPEAIDDKEAGPIVSEPSSSGSRISILDQPLSDKTLNSSCKPEKSCVEISNIQPVTIWTNGGLLGLEPSKPPDFVVATIARKDSMTSNDQTGNSSRLGRDAGSINRLDHASGDGANINRGAKTGNGKLYDADVKASSEAIRENDKSSSHVFAVHHRLLVNGFHDNMPTLPGGRVEQDSSLNVGEQRNEHNTLRRTTLWKSFDEKFGHKLAEESLASSPPLEHMKISFHPHDGFEASKLYLRFPDGSHSSENMFASFQLVPEPATSLQGLGPESDGDTFCRSSPYNSDDSPSYHSESDSEQWESGEFSERKDDDLYRSLCKISSTEFVSNSLHHGEVSNNISHLDSEHMHIENGAESSLSGSSLDLPCLEFVNSESNGETMDKLNPIESHYLSPASPLPPPLPPMQWRILKTPANMEKDQRHAISEAQGHVFDLKLLGSTISQPSKQALNDQRATNEADAFNLKSKEQPKLNLQKEYKKVANRPVTDEKDDFLQQIRAKSFTLRPTTASKTTFLSGPAANDKVNAILKKASAIRQVVGSDDGEDDDSWSDS